MKTLNSFEELKNNLLIQNKVFVLLYKEGSEQSDCAFVNYKLVSEISPEAVFFTVDVTSVRDIHTNYGVNSVPSLLEFERGKLRNIYKGCYTADQLKAIINRHSVTITETGKSLAKNVIVYSTPTCSWCTTLKNYLRDNNIRFRDVDVSRDEWMAQEMVRKSGQQGVPQTEINGQIIVGFDREKINRLLEINH